MSLLEMVLYEDILGVMTFENLVFLGRRRHVPVGEAVPQGAALESIEHIHGMLWDLQ